VVEVAHIVIVAGEPGQHPSESPAPFPDTDQVGEKGWKVGLLVPDGFPEGGPPFDGLADPQGDFAESLVSPAFFQRLQSAGERHPAAVECGQTVT
jgi:hypothetical protein